MYSPRISEELIPKIYKVAKAKGVPMTKVVDEILDDALTKIEIESVPYEVKVSKVRYQIKEKGDDNE